ncbi:predicted protein, partial [Nematostella vectensis]
LAYVIVMILSLLGNVLVIAVVAKNRRMRTPVNFFLINMAVGDVLITVFFMPRMVTRILVGLEWSLDGLAGLVTCKVCASMQEFCSSLSILVFISIAIDRFLAVRFPLKRIINKQVSLIAIGVIWVSAFAMRFPVFYGLTLKRYGSKVYCVFNLETRRSIDTYYKFSFAFFYAIPLAVVIVLYSAIMVTLWMHKRPGAFSSSQQRYQIQRTRKVMKMLIAIVVNFTLCWFLYLCLPIITESRLISSARALCTLYYLRFFFSHVNCCLNPLVYLLFIENYRRGVKIIL